VAKTKPAKKAKAKVKPKAKAKPKAKPKTKAKLKSKVVKKKTAAKAKPDKKAAKVKVKAKAKRRKKLPPPPPLKAVKTALIPVILGDGSVHDPAEEQKPKKARRLRPAQIDELKKLLLIRRVELLNEIRDEIDQSQQGAKQRSADPTDQASDSADGDLALALAQSDTDELNQVEAALGKVESGNIGTCEQCGCGIPMERLRALPFATTCIDCKRKQELSSSSEDMDEAWEAVHASEEERAGDDD
jgi:RNA polymerase-binding transcription factor